MISDLRIFPASTLIRDPGIVRESPNYDECSLFGFIKSAVLEVEFQRSPYYPWIRDPLSREVCSEVAGGGDTWRYLASCLPLFSFPGNVLDTKVTSPYFVARTGQDCS